MTETNEKPFFLHLNDFDGPLDVLLHLIEKSKMNIYDIRIAEITDQYMKYIYDARKLNLDIVGEYFVMAAKLMLIKSKMLLPKEEVDAVDEPEADPREDLVNQLIEYKKFKGVTKFLKSGELNRRQKFTRSMISTPQTADELVEPSPFGRGDLMAAYVDALKRFRYNRPQSTVIHEWNFTIESQTKLVRKLLDETRKAITFEDLIKNHEQTEEIVTDFLTILEMTKYQEIKLKQSKANLPIEIKKGPAYKDGK